MKLSRFSIGLISLFITIILISNAVGLLQPVSGAGKVETLPQPTAGATATLPPEEKSAPFKVEPDGQITVDGLKFADMSAYFKSDYFQKNGKRCGTKTSSAAQRQAVPADCSLTQTNIQPEYYPAQIYTIPIVFHVIYNHNGTGNISDQQIVDQVQVLNEDFQAMTGTLGAEGFNAHIRFKLAGITRTQDDEWFNDTNEEAYKQALGWDQDYYLNVYVNTASGYLGYSYLPQDIVTEADKVYDGVVVLYEAVGGRDTGYGAYDQGRTLVHEIGHYLGLLHTFEGNGCYEGYFAGDLIADTPSENTDHYGCTQTYSCNTPDDIHNYMNYTDDSCMKWFTQEQANRAMCSLLSYRPKLFTGALTVTQQISPVPAQAGKPITYTLSVTNIGGVDLHALITDTLPANINTGSTAGGTTVLPGGKLQWEPIISTGSVWSRTVAITAALNYAGPLTNVVEVSSTEGADGNSTQTVTVYRSFWMPLIEKQ